MLIDKVENSTIITQEKLSIIELVKKLNAIYSEFANDNLIINLTSLVKLTHKDFIEFLQVSNTHREAKHSFVIVSSTIDIDETPEDLIIVPTLQEAHDIIEMEEMERDLGF
jgi:hypothetical protein